MVNIESGFDEKRLKRLSTAIRKDVEANEYNGGAVLVARQGEVGLLEAIGFADRKNNRPCHLDDIFHLMSITKVFTSLIILSHIEQGDLSLNSRVTDIIPGFKGEMREKVTVFHLLTHTGGTPREVFPAAGAMIGDHKRAVETALGMELSSDPGKRVDYSALWGHTLLCEIVRLMDGGTRALSEIYEDELFGPLGMKDTSLGRRSDLNSRLVPIVVCGPDNRMSDMVDEDVDPGCGISTIHDLFRFTEMLRRGGELDGVRILSPAMVKLATTIQTGTMVNEMMNMMFAERDLPPLRANIGLEILVRGEGVHFPCGMGHLTSPSTFGKFGTGSVGFWVDPACDVTFIFLSAGLLDETSNIYRFQRFSDMAMASVIL